VLGSSGSVVPLFERQIREGQAVTLTNRRMTRFFLTVEEMADLVLSAGRLMDGGETFVRKMTAIRIEDLVDAMIAALAPAYGRDPDEVSVDIIGRRLGETTHEEIMTEREAGRVLENDRFYVIPPDTEVDQYLDYDGIDGFEPAADPVVSSADADYLDHGEIVPFLRSADALKEQG